MHQAVTTPTIKIIIIEALAIHQDSTLGAQLLCPSLLMYKFFVTPQPNMLLLIGSCQVLSASLNLCLQLATKKLQEDDVTKMQIPILMCSNNQG